MARPRGIETGINATEEHIETRSNNVGHSPISRREKIRSGRPVNCLGAVSLHTFDPLHRVPPSRIPVGFHLSVRQLFSQLHWFQFGFTLRTSSIERLNVEFVA